MEQLVGKVAVVTGGASGIGLAMARRFRDDGMTVVLADVEQPALERAAEEIGADPVWCDVSDLASVEALASHVAERHGGAHLVCANAGVTTYKPLTSTTINDWRWVIGVNLWGVVHTVHTFLPQLMAQADGCHVVITASAAGLISVPGIAPYAASKHAVVSLGETLAAELHGSGVGVSVVCPGMVDTGIVASDRNRPEHLRDEQRPATAGSLPSLEAMDRSDPALIAHAVADAVRNDRFWVLTHPEVMAMVEQRHHTLSEAARHAG
jgi:NAD(P)-dependent dehydrogenase (short-subunit alcohol dehydrogenase family)